MTLTVGKTTTNVTTSTLGNGALSFPVTVPAITSGQKTYAYEIGGLSLGNLKVTPAAGSGLAVYDSTDEEAVELTYKNVILGAKIYVPFKLADNSPILDRDGKPYLEGDYYWTGTVTCNRDYEVVGNGVNAKVISFSFCPLTASGTYTFAGAAWLHKAP